MKTITLELYSYDELDEDAKEKAKQSFIDKNISELHDDAHWSAKGFIEMNLEEDGWYIETKKGTRSYKAIYAGDDGISWEGYRELTRKESIQLLEDHVDEERAKRLLHWAIRTGLTSIKVVTTVQYRSYSSYSMAAKVYLRFADDPAHWTYAHNRLIEELEELLEEPVTDYVNEIAEKMQEYYDVDIEYLVYGEGVMESSWFQDALFTKSGQYKSEYTRDD